MRSTVSSSLRTSCPFCTELSDKEISRRILNDAKVWLDNGTMFGREGERYQRINVATPRAILKEALDRICKEFNRI